MKLTEQQFFKIAGLVYRANVGREQTAENQMPTVFMNYSGHIDWLEVSIHTCGWISGDHEDFHFRIDCGDVNEKVFKTLCEFLECIGNQAEVTKQRSIQNAKEYFDAELKEALNALDIPFIDKGKMAKELLNEALSGLED